MLSIILYLVGVLAMFAVIVTVALLPGHYYNRVIDYWVMSRMGLDRHKAWEISGMNDVGDRLVGLVVSVVAVVGLTYMISDHANAAQMSGEQRAMAKIDQQQAYISGLERIVAACITDTHGKLIKIGDDYFLCGISPLGSFR